MEDLVFFEPILYRHSLAELFLEKQFEEILLKICLEKNIQLRIFVRVKSEKVFLNRVMGMTSN